MLILDKYPNLRSLSALRVLNTISLDSRLAITIVYLETNFFHPSICSKILILKNNIDYKILSAVSAKRFIKSNLDVLFTRANKGNTVVALGKNDYILKMETSLIDPIIYTLLKRNPVNKLLFDLKEIK